jgi:hypothetical protein
VEYVARVLEIIGAAVLVLAAAGLCGAAIWNLAGLRSGSPAAAAVGFAAVLALESIAIRLPGHATTAVILAGVLMVGSAVYLAANRTVAVLPGWAVISALLTIALAMLPFAVAGRAGLLGVGTNDDMAEHLVAALSLQDSLGGSASKLVLSGYPIGPHALAATVAQATGMSLERSFTGLMIAIPALLALAGGAVLGGRRPLRVAISMAVGLCYLQAAFLVQASFKEPIEALMLVAFVAALHEVERRRVDTRLWGTPFAVLAAGAVYVYSYAGLFWLGGTLAVWLALRVATRRPPRLRSALGPAAIAALVFLGLVAPEVPRIIRFAHSGYNREGPRVLGDLLHPLSPLEGLGVWPRLDFRFALPLASLGGVLAVLALLALLACVARSLRRRDFALPAGLIAAAGLYGLSATQSPYTAAKALVLVSPLVTLALGRELLLLARSHPARKSTRTAGVALLVAPLVAGVYSDVEVLRDGPVGPAAHATELARLRGVIGRQPTLFLGADDFVHWELRGATVATPPAPLYATTVVPMRAAKAWPDLDRPNQPVRTDRFAGQGLAYDFESVPAAVLDRFTYAIIPRSPYGSEAPNNWALVDATRSYGLWRRTGRTPGRQTLDELGDPGAILDCQSSQGRGIASRRGYAMVRPAPVVGRRFFWKGRVGYAGASARQSLVLTRGRWDISLQYASMAGVMVTGPGLRAKLPPSLEPRGPYWFAGTIHVGRTEPVTVRVTYRSLGALGRLVGASGLTRAPAPTGLRALGGVAATRAGSHDQPVSLRRACGRYVDWYRTF